MDKTQLSVLVVILNYSTYDLTIKLIRELREKLDYGNYAVMVVDNCSPNESAKVLRERQRELGYIFYANQTNAGYAAGNNIGLRYGIEHGFHYCWILNNDVEIRETNVLSHMVEIAERDARVGCVGPMIYSLSGEVCAPYVRRPSLWRMTLGIFHEKRLRQRFTRRSGKVYRVYGCCMLLKSEAMAAVNCMDERTFLYGEEDILAERMLAKDYVCYYDAEVSVTHKESASVNRVSANRRRFQIRENRKSMDLYLKEYRGFSPMARWACHAVRAMITRLR